MLRLLRWLMVTELIVDFISVSIDAAYFTDNMVWHYISIISNVLWLAYIFKSERVRHVFVANDWESAVNYIYPSKLK